MKNYQSTRGFTLIELLVVIAIISILSSIVYSSVALAKTSAVDSRKKADLTSIRTALQTYNIDQGHMPHNYDCSGATCVVNDGRTTLAIEDRANPDNPNESGRAYDASMQELVDAKNLSGIPRSPGGAGYTYYDYGPASGIGAIVGTTLDTGPASAEGIAGSCRPFHSPPLVFLDALTWFTHASHAFALTRPPVFEPPVLLCEYIQDGVWTEGPCPPATTNLCSTTSSKDYCICTY
ncbi:MAG: hypothetical protein JWO84_420 [Parcubacteria group bacterium]|nr:hypothetical protein [Parcubacteria group bacterium]